MEDSRPSFHHSSRRGTMIDLLPGGDITPDTGHALRIFHSEGIALHLPSSSYPLKGTRLPDATSGYSRDLLGVVLRRPRRVGQSPRVMDDGGCFPCVRGVRRRSLTEPSSITREGRGVLGTACGRLAWKVLFNVIPRSGQDVFSACLREPFGPCNLGF